MIKLFYGDVVNDPERKIIIIVFCEVSICKTSNAVIRKQRWKEELIMFDTK